jgi:predicted amidohydrolase
MLITHGTVLTGGALKPNHSLRTQAERIAEVMPDAEARPQGAEKIVDAAGAYVLPGFIDLHTHGAAGFDAMDATSEALAGMAAANARHGVTAFLPTTVTASREAILAPEFSAFTSRVLSSTRQRRGRSARSTAVTPIWTSWKPMRPPGPCGWSALRPSSREPSLLCVRRRTEGLSRR